MKAATATIIERERDTISRLAKAADYLRAQAGSHFDPRCVDAFFQVWNEIQAVQANHHDEPAFGAI